MKNRAIILILTTLALLAAGCGGSSEKDETKPTTIANTAATNTTPANVQPANVQNTNTLRRDYDAADQPRRNVGNTNSNRRVDADDVQTKSGNINTKTTDHDDSKKKGDPDDRGRRDNDGDEDDH